MRVESEDVQRRIVRHTSTAYLTIVGLHEQEKAMPVPALTPVTSEEQRRHREANLRREMRLAEPGDVGPVRN